MGNICGTDREYYVSSEMEAVAKWELKQALTNVSLHEVERRLKRVFTSAEAEVPLQQVVDAWKDHSTLHEITSEQSVTRQIVTDREVTPKTGSVSVLHLRLLVLLLTNSSFEDVAQRLWDLSECDTDIRRTDERLRAHFVKLTHIAYHTMIRVYNDNVPKEEVVYHCDNSTIIDTCVDNMYSNFVDRVFLKRQNRKEEETEYVYETLDHDHFAKRIEEFQEYVLAPTLRDMLHRRIVQWKKDHEKETA